MNGFTPGDPDVHPATGPSRTDTPPAEVDVLIIGGGPAGLTLFAFAADEQPSDPSSRIQRLCSWLAHDPASPVVQYTPSLANIDETIDVRAIFQQHHRYLDLGAMPAFLSPTKGRYGLRDYEKMFCPNPTANIFEMRGVEQSGCVVLVRPDQHIANVLPLDGFDELTASFAAIMRKPGDKH